MAENEVCGISLDYFYGMQAEMFSFLRIPKLLVKDGRFEKMSNEAKMLFGLLLDRMSLSMKNKWFDEDNRVYIIYTTDEIMIDLCIGTQKCVKLLKELETYGLIERKKQGFSKPDIIYIKNFSILANDGMEMPKAAEAKVRSRREKKSKHEVLEDDDSEDCELSTNVDNSTVFPKSKHESFENQNAEVLKIETREFPESKDESFENQNTRVSEIETREFPKSKLNNTNIINTDISDTNDINTDNINSGIIISHPISSNSESGLKKEQVSTEDGMRLDVNRKQGVYFPLDYTEPISLEEEQNMICELEDNNGIPYSYVSDPEKMKTAMQVLFDWNYQIQIIDSRPSQNQNDHYFKLMLRNMIYMATSLEPVIINSGKQIVTYSKFLDRINVIYHEKGRNLHGFSVLMERCIERYDKNTYEQEIVNPDAYAKSVIWSTLQNYDADYSGWFNYDYSHIDWDAVNKKIKEKG